MDYIAVLSGEHAEIPLAELEAVIRISSKDYSIKSKKGRTVFFQAEKTDFSRLGYTKEVAELIKEFRMGSIPEMDDIRVDGSFAVRPFIIEGDSVEKEELAAKIGGKLSGKNNHVDLEKPETVFRVFVDGDQVYLSKRVFENDGGSFEKRRSHLRPFSSPVSLHPKLARSLVNLSGVKKDGFLLDPFCGTGGILIESGMIGVKVKGIDKDPKMVEGCIKNLEHYGIEEKKIIKGDAFEKISKVGDVDVIVTDLPYGRASKKDLEIEEMAENMVENGKKLDVSRIVLMTNKKRLLGLKPDFKYFVHRSLDRYIYVLNPQKL